MYQFFNVTIYGNAYSVQQIITLVHFQIDILKKIFLFKQQYSGYREYK